jgi:hypothetical protein
VRVATWNLERAAPESQAGVLQLATIEQAAADAWVFTEAHEALALPGYETTSSHPMLTIEPARFATIAARSLRALPLPELPTGVAAIVAANGRDWLVVGVCMPWRHDAPALPSGAGGGATTGSEQWRAVLACLDSALRRLLALVPHKPLLLAGDFNQTLEGYVVGSRQGRTLLADLLSRHALSAYTATEPSSLTGCYSIDHICGPDDADARACTWKPALAGRSLRPITDHAGYLVSLT